MIVVRFYGAKPDLQLAVSDDVSSSSCSVSLDLPGILFLAVKVLRRSIILN